MYFMNGAIWVRPHNAILIDKIAKKCGVLWFGIFSQQYEAALCLTFSI